MFTDPPTATLMPSTIDSGTPSSNAPSAIASPADEPRCARRSSLPSIT